MIQPNLNPQRLSDRAIALDCLFSSKALATRDAFSIQESAHSQVREVFERMSADHLRMQWEIFEYAKQNGWYPVIHATEQTFGQLPRFQPATTQHTTQQTIQQTTQHTGQQGYGGFGNDQATVYTGSTPTVSGQTYEAGAQQGVGTFGAHYGLQQQQEHQSQRDLYGQQQAYGQYGQYGQHSQYSQHSQHAQHGQGQFGQVSQYGQQSLQSQYGQQAEQGLHGQYGGYGALYGSAQGDPGFEAAEELGEFSHRPPKSRQQKEETRRESKSSTTQISRRLE